MLHSEKAGIYDGENDMMKRYCVALENAISDRIFELEHSERTYHDGVVDGLLRAHGAAMGCLPIPCGNREKLRAIGEMMGIPIQAIEKEIKKVKEEKR